MISTATPIRIAPRRVAFALAKAAAALIAAHLVLLAITVVTGRDYIFGLVPLFDLDVENNVPSFFSGSLLLLNGILIWLVAQLPFLSHHSRVWYVLAGVFVFLSCDELFGVHEHLTRPFREALRTSALLYYPWVIGYAVPVLTLIVWFIPSWRSLDAPARTRLVTAGVLYFMGAVVMELIGGAYDEAFGHDRTLAWGLLVAVEESLEMAGLLVLTHAVLMLLAPSAGGAAVVIGNQASSISASITPDRAAGGRSAPLV